MLLGYINYVTGSHYYGRCHLHMYTRGRYVGLVMGRGSHAAGKKVTIHMKKKKI